MNNTDDDYNRYLETGMVPIMGVCAHGPDAKTLSEVTYKDMVAHGFNGMNIPAGPVGEDGKNIKPKKDSKTKIDKKLKTNTKKNKKDDKNVDSIDEDMVNKKLNERLNDLEVNVKILASTLARLSAEFQKFCRDNAF